MNKQIDINLSTLFRRNLDTHAQDGMSIKQEFLNEKHQKSEHRSNVFLVDKRYALKLDELI